MKSFNHGETLLKKIVILIAIAYRKARLSISMFRITNTEDSKTYRKNKACFCFVQGKVGSYVKIFLSIAIRNVMLLTKPV